MVINTVAHQLYSILYAFSSTALESRAVSSSPVALVVRSICLLLLLATSNMGRTRSGREIVYTEASYGRAARAEATRKRKKRQLASTSSVRTDNSSVVIVGGTPPRSTTRQTRGQIQLEASLGTPPSVYTRVGATPPSNGNRILRGTRAPTCSDYGMSRHYSFQGDGFFFCNACDVWDSLLPDDRYKKAAGPNRQSRRVACTANHDSFCHPTTLSKDFCRSGVAVQEMMASKNTGRIVAGMNHDEEGCSESDRNDSDNSTFMTADNEEIQAASEHDSEEEDAYQHDGDEVAQQEGTTCDSDTAEAEAEAEGVVQVSNQLEKPSVDELILKLQREVRMLRRWNSRLVLQMNRMKTNKNPVVTEEVTTTASSAYQNEIAEAIKTVTGKHNRRWKAHRTGSLIAAAVWNCDGFQSHFLRLVGKYIRDNVFTPYNILREMDLAGGTLSYEGIDILRRVETRGVKYFRGSIIPSKSEIKRMAGMVEWYAQEHCPFTMQQTTKGESIRFDYAKTMLLIVKAFHLDDIGKARSLTVASSIDGASLSKNLSIIAGGVKIIDVAARCPSTKRPLLDDPVMMSPQSRNVNIPLQLMMGRETKETFTEFATLFKFFDDLSEETTMPIEMTGFKPFQCLTNCDLSAQWKGLCKGGAAKVHTLPCTCCATESNDLATPNATACTRWCHDHASDPEWMCFHKPTATPERVVSMKAEVENLLSLLGGTLHEIQSESKMDTSDVELVVPPESSKCNPLSIHFCPANAMQRQSFSQLATSELILRGLDINGTLEMRREKLVQALRRESTIERLCKEISHGEVREGAYFLLMQTLPCVLHMENRNGSKLLTMAFIEGLSNAKKRLSYTDINAEGKRVSQFIADIERLINTAILGTTDDPCQWMCPYDAKKKELGPITMDNVRTRRVVDGLDIIVDLCVIDEDRKSWWSAALNNYRIAMVLLRKRDDLTNPMIVSYQNHADLFFQAWIRLWQKEGITNYIHMIGAGHISDYLYKWKNLYRFSQQGWEAMNSLIKTFFFRRTNHGGGARGLSKKSRLIPIGRWLQRRLLFLTRIDEATIRQYALDHPIPSNHCTQAVEDDVYDIYE
jgi:hypothetical protein